MDSSFDTPHQEAQHAPLKLSVVVDYEDPEILARWAAAQKIQRIETRIIALRLISQDTRSNDLRDAIDGAIEDCELVLGKLERR